MSSGPQFTLGVEEEFQIVDAVSRHLTAGAGDLLDRLDTGGPRSPFTGEVQLSMVESRTAVCETLGELRAEVHGRRRELVAVARAAGYEVAAAGLLPLIHPGRDLLSPDSRYERIIDVHAAIIRDQVSCGCHVHVGVGDRETAVTVLPHLAPWLPVLLALSASSPFDRGRDTGYASYRTMTWNRWPTAHAPPAFASRQDYEDLVDALIRSETIIDGGQVYWDARPSRRFPTVEFRIADSTTLLDEALLQAGLARGLVVTAWRAVRSGRPPPDVRPELVEAARWHAARWGLADRLLDPFDGQRVTARRMVERLLEHVRDALDSVGDGAAVKELAEAALARGSSAARQRRVHAATGDLGAVVDHVVAETAGER